MDRGRNADTIQYETMRKLRSHIVNFMHTCSGGIGARFTGEEGAAGAVSNSPTNTEWFWRMGDVWMPDRPVTIQELSRCLELLEDDWDMFEKDDEGRLKLANLACMLITGFFAALWGEEIIRADVGAMRKYWEDTVNVKEEYSVYRSLRRGATTEAQNVQVPSEVIEANNRWRKHSRSRGLTPGMSMMERYTDAKASVPSLIRFSGAM
jgi:hypothetical protein